MINSIWAENSNLPAFPRLERNIRTEVLIVGGGLAGILCAHKLSRAGVDCVLIEADRICGGATRNTTAKITSQHGAVYGKLLNTFGKEHARQYWEANEAAISEYQRLCQDVPCDFSWEDNFIFFRDSEKKLRDEMAALEQLEIPAELTKSVSLPFSVSGAIRFPNQAQFNPLKLVSGIAKGLHIYENTRAREFGDHFVVTDGGGITASKIVIATHFPIINKHGSYFLKLYQQRSYVLALENAGQVDGMYLDGAENGLSLRNYGNLLLLGGGGHRTGKQGGGWEELEAFWKKYYPDAREVCRWAAQDCMSLDGIPYIGQYSKRTPDLYVATGFNKWGMSSAMAAAGVLCDLVQGRGNAYGELFSPSRTVLRPQLLVNGVSAIGNLITPTKPRCPHMGCALKWNPQERTWDCPCHGSRFSEQGSLLDNPATDDLPK